MKNKMKMCFGIGAPSILIIFVSLSLTTLSVLSLTTANANYKLALKTVDNVKSYYEADNIVENWICETYENLNNGILPKDKKLVVPISDKQSLEVIIEVKNNDIQIISQKVLLTNQWNYN